MAGGKAGTSGRTTRALWVVQGLLAIIFLFTGGSKFVMSVEEMNAQMKVPLPGWFLHFIGVCELLGAAGVIVRPQTARPADRGDHLAAARCRRAWCVAQPQ